MNDESLFAQACGMSGRDRAAFLDAHCKDDISLRKRVEALLYANDNPDPFLNGHSPPGLATISTAMSEGPGTLIGGYKLKEKIGEGGMGLVFVAEQRQPVRRRVALKIIKPGLDSAVVSARFEAERQALAIMDHQNIAKVYDGGTTDSGRAYFVMELIQGVPITEFCDANKLTPRQRLELFVPVCHAIQHAHQKGIIHRDIKPSNVLVTMYDDKPVPKVIDFGVAKAIEQRLADKSIYTQFGTLVGTLEYMSPEQVEMNAFGVDTRSDVYSLGVLLYELLTGTTPLEGQHLRKVAFDEVRRLIKEEEPQRPSVRLSTSGSLAKVAAARQTEPAKLARLVRGELDWIVLKCLEKDRTRRYETANGLARDVERYLDGEPVQACPPSAAYRIRKFIWRYKGAVVAAALVVSALVIGVIGTTIGMVRAIVAEQLAGDRLKDLQKANASTTRALDDARQAKIETEKTLDVSEQRRTAAERSLYFQKIAKAHFEWWNNDVGRADQVLDQCADEYRNWEWHYLKGLCHSELFTFRGHTDRVRDVAFSRDGLRLASASQDATVRIWELESGRELFTLRHKEPVATLQFSPDGRWLATGGGTWGSGRSGVLKVWDLATGQAQLERTGHGDLATAVAFHPNGKLLASAGFDQTVKLWDLDTGDEIRTLRGHKGVIRCISISPDGEQIASGGGDRTVKRWRVSDGLEIATLPVGADVTCLAISPDGQRLLSGDYSGSVKLWDNLDSVRSLNLSGHSGAVYQVVFSPDGQFVVSAGADGAAKVWDTSTGQVRNTLRGHSGQIFSVAISPGGRCLATAGWDRTVKVFDLTKSQTDRLVSLSAPGEGRGGNLAQLTFSPDGSRFATATSEFTETYNRPSFLQVWDTVSRERLLRVSRPRGFMSLAFSPDGKRLAVDWGHEVRILDSQTGKELSVLPGHAKQVHAVAYHPLVQQLASAGEDGEIKIWDLANGSTLRTLSGHTQPVTALAFHRTGKLLASCSRDGSWRLWDTANGLSTFSGAAGTGSLNSGSLNGIAFSPSGDHFATAGDDGTIRIWKTKTGDEVRSLSAHVGPVSGVCYSADGLRLASSGADGKVRVWDAPTGQEALTLHGRSQELHSVAFCPNGRFLAAGHAMLSEVMIWETAGESAERRARNVLTWRALEAEGFRARRQWPAALEHLDRLVAAEPEQPRWFYLRGNIHRGQGDYGQAISDHWRVVESNPKHTLAIQELFNATRAPESRALSIDFFKRAITTSPDNAMAHWYLGNGLWYEGKLEESLVAFQRGRELDPHDLRHPHSIANNLTALGRLDEAIMAYGKAIEIRPEEAHLYYDLALALHRQGRLQDAIASWRKCVDYDANHILAHAALAWELATTPDSSLRDPKGAVFHARRAVTLEPNVPNNLSNLGVALYRAGNAKAAVEKLQTADQKANGDYHHRFFLAMAYWQMGEKDKARQAYENGVQWMDQNLPENEQLRRFRAEAEELLKQESGDRSQTTEK